jgi:hypothetical protein
MCSFVKVDRRFRGIYRPYLKRRSVSATLQVATSQIATILLIAAIRTWNLTLRSLRPRNVYTAIKNKFCILNKLPHLQHATRGNLSYEIWAVDTPVSLILNSFPTPCNTPFPYSCYTNRIASTHRTIKADGDKWPRNEFIAKNERTQSFGTDFLLLGKVLNTKHPAEHPQYILHHLQL